MKPVAAPNPANKPDYFERRKALKINNNQTPAQGPATQPRIAPRRLGRNAEAVETEELPGLLALTGEDKSFADVLFSVGESPRREERGSLNYAGEGNSQNDDDSPERQAKETGDSDKADQASRLASQPNNLREPSLERETGPLPVRAILHISDLERIVALCRVNTFENRQEVLLQLPNSIFSGLRVKITSDARGGVTTEFLAQQESVRAQLAARANELGELLQSRGIKLAQVKTSLDTGFSGNNDNAREQGEPHPAVSETARRDNQAEPSAKTTAATIDESANSYLA
jgi:hypothetical protein